MQLIFFIGSLLHFTSLCNVQSHPFLEKDYSNITLVKAMFLHEPIRNRYMDLWKQLTSSEQHINNLQTSNIIGYWIGWSHESHCHGNTCIDLYWVIISDLHSLSLYMYLWVGMNDNRCTISLYIYMYMYLYMGLNDNRCTLSLYICICGWVWMVIAVHSIYMYQ